MMGCEPGPNPKPRFHTGPSLVAHPGACGAKLPHRVKGRRAAEQVPVAYRKAPIPGTSSCGSQEMGAGRDRALCHTLRGWTAEGAMAALSTGEGTPYGNSLQLAVLVQLVGKVCPPFHYTWNLGIRNLYGPVDSLVLRLAV